MGWWPATNFSDYKTSVIGRYSRSVALVAWDVDPGRGFSLEAVPNTQRGISAVPYDEAELLVRVLRAFRPFVDVAWY